MKNLISKNETKARKKALTSKKKVDKSDTLSHQKTSVKLKNFDFDFVLDPFWFNEVKFYKIKKCMINLTLLHILSRFETEKTVFT